ncbi:MAG: type II/IV secretion system protein [Planctomycetes bacterium]|nr:type II/IV secretion system protein [Planctomycetota bacterium]
MDNIVADIVEMGLLDQAASHRVQEVMAQGSSLYDALTGTGVPVDKTLQCLSKVFSYPFIVLDQYELTKEFLSQFPARILLDKHVLPLFDSGTLFAVVGDPFDTSGVDELRLATGQDFSIALAPITDIDRCVKRLLGVGADSVQSMISDAQDSGLKIIDQDTDEDMDLTASADEAPIIRFVNQILTEAIELRATDVHIEPFEGELRVRYRVDGVLQQTSVASEVKQFQPAIVSRLKILSKLDIAEKRVPQDGRIKIRIADREVDVRVSVIPMLYGEAIVLRLLDRGSVLLGLEKLGMSARDKRIMNNILMRPHGIILVTGPTGSGKTTSLYASLAQINDIDRKIITIEDPIEYQLFGINQIQVARKAGLTFASGLRAILRHDPDVVLIGEIRDVETAEIAVQASLTGHLVFSTLHTNDAPSAMTRLVDMGVEPYLVASSLEAVIAQRLIRLICPHCKTEMPDSEAEPLRHQFTNLPDVLYHGTGCRHCQGTGYSGRQGIFEMMVITEELRAVILENASSQVLRRLAASQGMLSLREDGMRHLAEGTTTVKEIMRVTKDEQLERGASGVY